MNQRPCGTCKHQDGRVTVTGQAYCWVRYEFHRPDEIVPECTDVSRADGNPPPGQIRFAGDRR